MKKLDERGRLTEPVTITVTITTDHPGAYGRVVTEARALLNYFTRKLKYSGELRVETTEDMPPYIEYHQNLNGNSES